MKIPLEISSRDFSVTPALEERIRAKALGLERFHPRLIRCRVHLEGHGPHHLQGEYTMTLDVTMPDGEAVVSREHGIDVQAVLRDTFQAARRMILERQHQRHGKAKHHHEHPHGRVSRLPPGEEFGFLETDDGREVYFHRNSLRRGAFEDLAIGDRLEFEEEPGEKGPQATMVLPSGRPRPGPGASIGD